MEAKHTKPVVDGERMETELNFINQDIVDDIKADSGPKVVAFKLDDDERLDKETSPEGLRIRLTTRAETEQTQRQLETENRLIEDADDEEQDNQA